MIARHDGNGDETGKTHRVCKAALGDRAARPLVDCAAGWELGAARVNRHIDRDCIDRRTSAAGEAGHPLRG